LPNPKEGVNEILAVKSSSIFDNAINYYRGDFNSKGWLDFGSNTIHYYGGNIPKSHPNNYTVNLEWKIITDLN
jgi:hypothetical protein